MKAKLQYRLEEKFVQFYQIPKNSDNNPLWGLSCLNLTQEHLNFRMYVLYVCFMKQHVCFINFKKYFVITVKMEGVRKR